MQMTCAWKELTGILPPRLREQAEAFSGQAQDIRLRLGGNPEVVTGEGTHFLIGNVTEEDLNFVVNTASRYSPWSAVTISQGYLTAPGGHRIGICGEAVIKQGQMEGIRRITSLCIRVSRDFPGIAEPLALLSGSILILGAPGWGKTTLLRDLIRQKSSLGAHISVVDERGELFPAGVNRGSRTEVMTGCPKPRGIEILLRTMGPDMIALDEITAREDCEALRNGAWCGVSLIATAHAASLQDYLHREVYSPLVQQHLFDHLVILHPDRRWHLERSGAWTTNGSVRY
jgi:stage III sporulation protein AA